MPRPRLLIPLALLAPAALAAGPGGDKGGAAVAALLAPALLVLPVQLLFAALFPRAVRRLARAVSCHAEATVAWGVGALVLILLVGVFLANVGGTGGQALAIVIGTVGLLAAMVGGSGYSYLVGRWSLRRDGRDGEPTALAVPLGAMLLGVATWAPLAGQLLSLALLVLSLGAVVRATVGAPRLPVEGPPALAVAASEVEAGA